MTTTPAPFFAILHAMTRFWEDLTRDNLAFLNQQVGDDELRALLDQRELVLEENRSLEQRFLAEWNTDTGNPPVQRLSEALDHLEKQHPAGESALIAFRQALEQLIDSDRQVQEKLEQSRQGLESQLKSLKRSSSLVKGYKQVTPYDGSCFIDKIR